MTWVKLDDNFPDHPKLAGLSDAVKWFHVRAMCYSARYQTGGEITPAILKALHGKPAVAATLVEAGLWDTTSRTGWAIHDFEVYNPPRESRQPVDTTELSRIRAEAGRQGGQRSGEARRSKPEANDEANEANLLKQNEANSEATLTRAQPRAGVPSRPVPSRPDPLGSNEPEEEETSSSSSLPAVDLASKLHSLVPSRHLDARNRRALTVFAQDFASLPEAVQEAIDECGRNGELPFAANLRKYMPDLQPDHAPVDAFKKSAAILAAARERMA